MKRLPYFLSMILERWLIPRWKYDALGRAYDEMKKRNEDMARLNIVLVARLNALDREGVRKIDRNAA